MLQLLCGFLYEMKVESFDGQNLSIYLTSKNTLHSIKFAF